VLSSSDFKIRASFYTDVTSAERDYLFLFVDDHIRYACFIKIKVCNSFVLRTVAELIRLCARDRSSITILYK
jgi:hypothetical protein